MKKIIFVPLVVLILALAGCGGNIVRETYHPNPTFQALDNYGNWINVPGIGLVWQPYNEADWQPYYDGRWVWTDSGWMWAGNEPYAWIVYHYGYWDFEEPYGWIWIPNYDWAPARVSWYYSNGYVGWSPLPPPGIRQRVVYNNVYINKVWVFVPENHFVSRDVSHYRTRDAKPDIETIRNNGGGRSPDVRNIERAAGTRIEPVNPVREQVTAGSKKLIRVRVSDKPRQQEIIRSNPPANNILVPNPPAAGVRPEQPVSPAQPDLKKNKPVKPGRAEKVLRPENGRNENSLRNEGRKPVNNKRPELRRKAENKKVNPRTEKKIKKEEKKAVKENASGRKKERKDKIIR